MSKKKTIYIKKSDAYHYAELEHEYVIMMHINDLPAEDVRPVKHGKWVSIDNNDNFKCSKCKFKTNRNSFQYCPNCGATMDLKEGEKNENVKA